MWMQDMDSLSHFTQRGELHGLQKQDIENEIHIWNKRILKRSDNYLKIGRNRLRFRWVKNIDIDVKGLGFQSLLKG